MRLPLHRTVHARVKQGPFTEALAAMQLSAKGLRNMGVFLVRNALASYGPGGKIKPVAELHANQVEALTAANEAAAVVNATRMEKNKKKAKEREALECRLKAGEINQADLDEAAKKLKPSELFPDFMGPEANCWAILDDGLLDKLMQIRLDQRGERPYLTLPAKASQQVRMQIQSEFRGWIESCKSYKGNPKKFKGTPKMPSYLGKNDRSTVKIFAGTLGKNRFPTIKGRDLRTSFEGPPLSAPAFEAYAAFDWERLRTQFEGRVQREGRQGLKLVEVRFVPSRSGSSKIEGVFSCEVEVPDECFMAKTLSAATDGKVKDEDLDAFVAQTVASLQLQEMPRSASVDMGLNNLLTVSFSTGRKSIVVSNARPEARVGHWDKKIDVRKSLCAKTAPPAIAALALRRQNGEQLPKHEHILLRAFEKSVEADPALQKLRGKRERWLADANHQVAAGIKDALAKENIEFVAIGRNLGWKTESDMGRQGNRRFHASPHALLIEDLKAVLPEAGILVMDREESYTSQASFAFGEPIQTYGELDAAKPPRPTHPTSKKSSDTLAEPPKEACPFQRRPQAAPSTAKIHGRRRAPKGSKGKATNQFLLPRAALTVLAGRGLGSEWLSLHADANGAFNILRKAMPCFQAHAGLSPRFELWWLSPEGLKPFKNKKRKANS